jgi:hypothetical protein
MRRQVRRNQRPTFDGSLYFEPERARRDGLGTSCAASEAGVDGKVPAPFPHYYRTYPRKPVDGDLDTQFCRTTGAT